MPFSSKQGKFEIVKWLSKNARDISSMIDFGAGAGNYAKIFIAHAPRIHRTAVEVFEPYIKKFRLASLYQKIIVADFSKMELPAGDLAILGDVVEHLPKEPARAFVASVVAKYPHVIVSIPVGSYPQGTVYGNDFERHLSEWTIKELDEMFKNFPVRLVDGEIGVFIK